MPDTRPAPAKLIGILRHIGPGLIITASIVGAGELIVTPKLGGEVGYKLLWLVILGCGIKVFVQVEFGRIAITRGLTTLEALDLVPGPRFIVSWLLWIWLAMFGAMVLQVAGLVGALAEVFSTAGLDLDNRWLAVLVGLACAVPLAFGHYRLVERFSISLVFLFTICTLVAVVTLMWTDYRITPTDILNGLRFQLPGRFTTAFAALGIIGVGASELIYYPYWCLEKGYGRFVGAREHSSGWLERARGWMHVMQIDAWIAMVIYTAATLAFYLLGAAVLHGQGLQVTDQGLIETLAHMYLHSFGSWSLWVFLLGAFTVLFSTVFAATASNARLLVNALTLFRVTDYSTPEQKRNAIRLWCVLLPAMSVGLFCLWEKPLALVLVGALAQGIMLPFLAGAALYFRYRLTVSELKPGVAWSACLWLSAIALVATGFYSIWSALCGVPY